MRRTPEDCLEIFLQPGEFYFGDHATRIRTVLGSCVAITMWHPELRIGGMCHYMLPRRPRNAIPGAPLDGRYADEAMKLFLRELRGSRTSAADYQVKLFGGGQMFPARTGSGHMASVSERNVIYGRAAIADGGFRLAAQDLGGFGHRNVILDLWSGDVWVRQNGPKVPPSPTP